MEWIKRLEIIKQKTKEALAQEGKRDTDSIVAEFLETSPATYSRWKNNRQMPDVITFIKLATKLNLSANWLLLGIGEPEAITKTAISECDVYIADTLRDLVVEIDRPMEEIALAGGMYPRELDLIINRGKELPSEAMQRWIHAYRVNANFLLAQVGQPFLTEDEYTASGPLTWVRERRGDFTYQDEEEITDRPLSTSERARLQRELADARRTITAQEEALSLYREKSGQGSPRGKGEKTTLPNVAREQR